MFDICQTLSYTRFMALEKYITTRELLREFKKYKEMLLSGKIMHLVIALGDGKELEVRERKKGLSGKEFAERIRALKKPIRIERPVDLFEDFEKRLERRLSDIPPARS